TAQPAYQSPPAGKEIKIDDVAAAAGTVGYELMCALALRVPVMTV
ncbi:TPA: hypothetical protein ACG1KH_004031, partial [Escherichia coli]